MNRNSRSFRLPLRAGSSPSREQASPDFESAHAFIDLSTDHHAQYYGNCQDQRHDVADTKQTNSEDSLQDLEKLIGSIEFFRYLFRDTFQARTPELVGVHYVVVADKITRRLLNQLP